MTLSDLTIERPILTWMMILALLVFGTIGYSRLGVDQMPKMEFPVVMVSATLEGATPEAMEEDVTEILEEHLNSIAGIRSIRSTTVPDISNVVVEFELGRNLDVAIQEVRDKIALARRDLPREIEPPVVSRMDMDQAPIIFIPFSTTRPPTEASEYIRHHVAPYLETIPGVGGVSIFGRSDRTIRIWLDGDSMRSRGLSASDVLTALRREHVEVPGGLVEGAKIEWSVKTNAEFRSIEALERMVVSRAEGALIYLEDVARVEDGEADRRTIARFNGKPTVGITIQKQSGGNTVGIADEVKRRIAELAPLLPDGIELDQRTSAIDFSFGIRESIAETQFALVLGGLLAVLTVFVFLRRTKPTLIVASAIPISLIATFGVVWMFGYTLNTMTLLGMTLAIGVVIDDAIIVLENIERHRELGKSPRSAAAEGTRQITIAATAATVSVAAVFLPVVFVEGIVGSFLGEFGLTVAAAVIVSLFVALTLTPMLVARMAPPQERAHGSIYHLLELAFSELQRRYQALLHWALAHRTATLGIALLSFLAAIFFGSRLDAEFFPPGDTPLFIGWIETAPGSTLDATLEYVKMDEEYLLGQPEISGLFAQVGGGGWGIGGPNRAMYFGTFLDAEERERTSQEVITAARAKLDQIPGRKAMIMNPNMMMRGEGGQFEVLLLGNLSLMELDRLADRMMRELGQRGGFAGLNKSLKLGLPELRVSHDREKAAALGVDAASLAQIVQVMIGGLDVGVFKEGGRRYDIRMRLEASERGTPGSIEKLYVRAANGDVVELRNLIAVEQGAAPSAITRTNRQRSVAISGSLEGKSLGTALQDAYAVAEEILPEGASLGLSGQAEAMTESFGQFGLAMLLGILAIYMVLAAQFESLIHPLTVMLAVPLAMVGALGGLLIGGMTLSIFSLIGIILLFGLVTKNSILLVDYANQLRAGGMDKVEAMRTAAPIRMRPVLMTALSMILGVLPAALGIGPGAETRAPMAVATAAGMFSSMVLTLVVIPVFYVVLDDFAEVLRHLPRRILSRVSPEPSAGGSS